MHTCRVIWRILTVAEILAFTFAQVASGIYIHFVHITMCVCTYRNYMQYIIRYLYNICRCYVALEASAPLGYSSSPAINVFQADGGVCPAPPQLSVDTAPSGPLDSRNHYVAEYLLRHSDDIARSVFFRRVQAGFVFSEESGVDGCSSFCADSAQQFCTIPSLVYSPNETNLTATIWYNNQVWIAVIV